MLKNVLAVALPLVAIAVIAALGGCGAPGPDSSGEEVEQARGTETKKFRIALVMKSLANEFFQTMEDGAREHQANHSDQYELIAQGIKDETDVSRQIQLVEQMIAQEVDALVIAPADSKALAKVLKRAEEAGMIVINIDNKLDEEVLAQNGLKIPFVGPDNRKGAYQVAAYLAKQLQPGDPVAIVEGAPNAFNAFQRKKGFEEALVEAGMRIVTSQTANWEMAQANQVVAGMITEHPDLKAVLCANDSMALGAVSALRAAGKLQDVKVVGFDNISAVQELLKKGEILATADQHGDQLAAFGIQAALDCLTGSLCLGPDSLNQETPVDLVTAESVREGTAEAS